MIDSKILEGQSDAPPPQPPALGIPGFAWKDLQTPAGLTRLLGAFDDALRAAEPALADRYLTWRKVGGSGLTEPEESRLLIEVAGHLSRFVGKLFGVEQELERLRRATTEEQPVLAFKRDFAARRVFKKGAQRAAPESGEWKALDAALEKLLASVVPDAAGDRERAVALLGVRLLEQEKGPDAVAAQERLRLLERWCQVAVADPDGRHATRGWTILRTPRAIDHGHLVELKRPEPELPERFVAPSEHHLRRRDGFRLTDRRMEARQALAEVDYCVLCHDREKDSCSTGFKVKDAAEPFKRNPLGIALSGCPLDERIGEMHEVRGRGDPLGALAIVCVDNPMLPGTGHRICNDCMKGCIFQKQEPVNIPQIETRVLTEVLSLPWGFEIFSLLTRWNPLNATCPTARPYNGKNVLVVGLGPAGYTLAHHLLNEGFGVVGIDGLKIEPLPGKWLDHPIRDFDGEVAGELDERILLGFGGVSEYGITVRWDKNFLTVIYLALARREKMRIYGGIRFGGTITLEDAWALGFDHLAIAAGAGRPTLIPLKNNLLRGIRKASDFLMALQLTGAYKRSSLANLQVRLPALVIGGGLTGIDTATELFAYYPIQVERVLDRHEELVRRYGEARALEKYGPEEREILSEFLEHGRAVRAERARAQKSGEEPDLISLVRGWGGVSLVYRKSLEDSPAYRLNHEEVEKSLEEGISYVERMAPVEALADAHGHVRALRFERQAQDDKGKWRATKEMVELPARTVCVAAGTSPNVTSEKERPGTFEMDGQFFQPYDEKGKAEAHEVPKAPTGFFLSHQGPAGQRVSYYGDNHPQYAGSVVKAMASAKHGFTHVRALFARELSKLDPARQPEREAAFGAFAKRLDDGLLATVERVNRLTPTIVEVVVRAPFAAERFQPGQFYRLQNYETLAPRVAGSRLAMEGIALTGAWTDAKKGLLGLIVLEMGHSSRLCAALRPGEPVVVMGPTGTPTEIPRGEKVLLAGGGLGNAVLFSIARALREAGNKVVYFAGYKKPEDVFKMDEIEAGTDQVIWSVDTGRAIAPRRSQDRSFVGNIVQAMVAYGQGELGAVTVPLSEVNRIIAIGSDRMMAAVKAARSAALQPFLKKEHEAIGSINSPMQCMMKEICAQCLCKHVDPVTGKESFVFSCFNQDQPLDLVDFPHLNERLKQNSVLEKQTDLWLTRLLEDAPGTIRI
jgi:NADPH-dependent glutamate synthase beta subunit-like oxidoreductase/NAD(P)H-flavin reductase